MSNEDKVDPSCKECFGGGQYPVLFVDIKQKIVIEDWAYCKKCYPKSSYSLPDYIWRNYSLDKEINRKEADILIEGGWYTLHVP